jgi:hypothetical protein
MSGTDAIVYRSATKVDPTTATGNRAGVHSLEEEWTQSARE